MTTAAAFITVLVIVGAVIAVVVAGLVSIRCPRCPDRPRMRPFDGGALEAMLSPIEQTERRIGAKHFTLRACPACRATDLERRPVSGLFAPCRRCTALATRQRHVIIREATTRVDGTVETRASCEHCHTIDVTLAPVPRLRRPQHGRPSGGVRFAGGFMPAHAHSDEYLRATSAGHVHERAHAHDAHAESHSHGDAYAKGGDSCSGGDSQGAVLAHEESHASYDASSYDSDASSYDNGSSYDSDSSSTDSSSDSSSSDTD